ncbi:MAG: hypothetical protein QM831_27820 [Kofleriaceae bacterium]
MGEGKAVVSGISVVSVVAVCGLRVCNMMERDERQRHMFDNAYANSQAYASLVDHTASSEWKRADLPGFSIELPGTAPEPTGDYAGGMIQQSYPNQYAISWMQGVTPEDLDRETVSRTMVDAVQQAAHVTLTSSGDRVITVGGKPAHEMDFKAPTGESANLVFAMCGSRLIQFTVVGTSSLNADNTLQHMLDSFKCTPDMTKESTRDEIALTPTKGWKRIDGEGYLVLENRAGDRISSAAFVEQDGLGFESQLETALKMAGYHVHKGAKHGTKSSYVGTFEDKDGTSLDVTVLAWKCPNRIATITVPKGSPSGMALAESGRCLGADEKAPSY